jgi:integrase
VASIVKIGARWRALVRKGGHTQCKTFGTRGAAKSWARTVETEIDELKSAGKMQPRGITVADLIDRYTREIGPIKPWGRSKSADLERLRNGELGATMASSLDHTNLFNYFKKQRDKGAGPVVIASLVGYLVGVIETASTVWRLAVPLDTVKDVRDSLKKLGMIRKSEKRERRVTDAEIKLLLPHLTRRVTPLPLEDIVWFCLASAMRISEVCRLEWADLNETDRTIRIRDRKHPTAKQGNHQIVPLLNATGHDAFEIVTRQPKNDRRIFPANPETIGDYFTRAVQDSGIEDLHLHDLRHEAISRLFEAGYQIHEVSIVSGHRDWSMLKRYTHLRAVDLHRAKIPSST